MRTKYCEKTSVKFLGKLVIHLCKNCEQNSPASISKALVNPITKWKLYISSWESQNRSQTWFKTQRIIQMSILQLQTKLGQCYIMDQWSISLFVFNNCLKSSILIKYLYEPASPKISSLYIPGIIKWLFIMLIKINLCCCLVDYFLLEGLDPSNSMFSNQGARVNLKLLICKADN